MRWIARSAAITLGVAALVVSGAVTASAATTKAGAPNPTVNGATMPKGYIVVSSAPVDNPSGAQTFADVGCPAGTVVLGGGVYTPSVDLTVNINASYPSSDTGWATYVNNYGLNDDTITAWAACANQPKDYSIVTSAGVDNPAGTEGFVNAACPSGAKVLGGGAFNSSVFTSVDINSSWPTLKGPHHVPYTWASYNNNNSGADNTMTAFAVCGKEAGYNVQASPATDNPAGTETGVTTVCPVGTVPIGGGAYATSSDLLVNINATVPDWASAGNWTSWINNSGVADNTMIAYAVCAK